MGKENSFHAGFCPLKSKRILFLIMIKSFFEKKNKWDYGKKAQKIEKKWKKMKKIPVLGPFFRGQGNFLLKIPEKSPTILLHFFNN